jgi:hypothetical protein
MLPLDMGILPAQIPETWLRYPQQASVGVVELEEVCLDFEVEVQ